MLESPAIDSSITARIATVKRYAPPNQRNRSLGRRKSGGDHLERANGNSNDGEKNQISASRSTSTLDDAGGRYQANDSHRTGLIPLQGCSGSDAFQLLNNRWMAALNAYNNLPYDSPERPVMYTKKSHWGHAMVPHQLMSQGGGASSSGLQKDFLSELQLAMHGTSVSSNS
ncbi:PREDICTED: uncharacterized protein LOC109215824 isoform X2 [Nicotiana attenuata]|uniref:Uncharacterized protein n=1 Tax=Nicotiana attenuata TaxID=49451 RepID=A0A1J6KSM7_NICAT|nr:PREDICTED: uncharacterized protein LOC109215824 isoform X2 [Nicotiana attenuata]OIT25803.1 hypothetical protein A4A49_27611 [Nicotiana attenuata]